MSAPPVSPAARKSWLRFSLWSLFLLTSLVCITTAYLLQRRELQRKDPKSESTGSIWVCWMIGQQRSS
jgi:hypothetical protein